MPRRRPTSSSVSDAPATPVCSAEAWGVEGARGSSAAALEGICACAMHSGPAVARSLLHTLMPFAPTAFASPDGAPLMRGLSQLLATLPQTEALPALSMLLSAPLSKLGGPQDANPLLLVLNLDLIAAWVPGACACMASSTAQAGATPIAVLSPALDAASAYVTHPSPAVAEAACWVIGNTGVGCGLPAPSTWPPCVPTRVGRLRPSSRVLASP